jgi:uncharacterized protein
MTEVNHDVAAHRFSTKVDGELALLEYTLVDDVMTITHTRVSAPIRGRGVAAELMRAALQLADESQWKVVPACAYAAAYMRQHGDDDDARQHQDELLDEALEETFPASDPPAVGISS